MRRREVRAVIMQKMNYELETTIYFIIIIIIIDIFRVA